VQLNKISVATPFATEIWLELRFKLQLYLQVKKFGYKKSQLQLHLLVEKIAVATTLAQLKKGLRCNYTCNWRKSRLQPHFQLEEISIASRKCKLQLH
jgi:hypothetical protein